MQDEKGGRLGLTQLLVYRTQGCLDDSHTILTKLGLSTPRHEVGKGYGTLPLPEDLYTGNSWWVREDSPPVL